MIAIRLLMAALASLSLAGACECSDPTVQNAKERANVIFRGTITALRPLRPTDKRVWIGDPGDTGKIAVFRVARVWKGEVGPVFEMPAIQEGGGCWGFAPQFLKLGTELIVYAFRVEGAYFTGICSRTNLPKFATKDFEELGPGEPPRPSPARSNSK